MAGETIVTVVGNLVDEVELRYSPSGTAVARFRVASVPRTFNKDTNQWEDAKDGLFLSCSVWRQQAEHAAETLSKGMRVIVQGRLKQRSWEDKDGTRRTSVELDVEEVGPSLKNATARVEKASRSGGQGQQGGQRGGQGGQQQGPAGDPWAQPAGQASGGWGGDEPAPF